MTLLRIQMCSYTVGRTTRLGRQESAIVFLLPKEEACVEFLRIRRVPLEERKSFDDASDIVPEIRYAAKKDRDVMEKGIREFVSYICVYKEHHRSYIFRWKELEIGKLGMGFGLLQLPSMPEVKEASLTFYKGFYSGAKPQSGRYQIQMRDKYRQNQRNKNLQLRKATQQEEPKPKKPKTPTATAMTVMRKKTAKQRQAAQTVEDEYELAREYRLLKKLKKGAIDENEFAMLTGTEELL